MKVLTVFLSLFLCISFANSQTDWYPIDPMPGGGAVYSLAVNSQNYFFAVTNYGVFRSIDMGKTWQPVNFDFLSNPFAPIFPIQIVTNSKNETFLATSVGIYKSTDNGDSFNYWNEGVGDGTGVGEIYVSPDDDLYATNGSGLYRRTEADTAWMLVSSQLQFASSFTSSDDTTIYAAQTFAGVFKSTDNGNNWMPVNGTGLTSTFITALEYNPNDNLLYAGTGDSSLYVSANGGNDWQHFGVPTQSSNSVNYRIKKITNHNDEFDAIRDLIWFEDMLYIASEFHLYYTDNIFAAIFFLASAVSFTHYLDMEIGPPVTPLKTTSSYKMQANKSLLIATLSKGVFSYNETDSLTNISNGLTGYIPVRIVQTGDLQVIATAEDGLIISDGSEIRHSLLNADPTADQPSIPGLLALTNTTGNKALKASESGTVLFALYIRGVFSGIYRSSDLGITWEDINVTFNVSSFAKDDVLNLYAASDQGVHFSSDMGDTWELRNNGLPGTNVVFLVFNAPTNTLFCILDDGALYKSSDKGVNWTQAGNTTLGALSDLEISPTGEMYASSTDSGIAHSTDNGETWEKINNGLPSSPYYPPLLAVNSSGDLFAGGYGVGVYKSNDNGENWQAMNGFPSDLVTTLYVNENDILFAGTFDRGIYSTQMPTLVEQISNVPKKFLLSQNYPNPFNPSTTIQFSLPEESFVRLEVFNLLGERVSTLVSETLGAGKYNYEWNAEQLPSGVYLYKLNADASIQTKKMLLLK